MIKNYFNGRRLYVATMHEKEKLVAPVLEQELGVTVVAPGNFFTDRYGTFTGEVERTLPPLEAAIRKCDDLAAKTGADLVLASEGSFGAHPVLGFIPADEEILVLKDYKNQLEIKTKVLSTATNFASNEYYDWQDLLHFATRAGFPSHALILRPAAGEGRIYKGIKDKQTLKNAFDDLRANGGRVKVETDMRAMYNPSRQKVILEAVEKLVEVINKVCPVCEAPGFDVGDVERGLPCNECETPTRSARAYVMICSRCGHKEKQEYPHRKMKEDPMYCDSCNP